jgi:hypothetical protein
MKSNSFFRNLVLVSLLAVSVPLLAKPLTKSLPIAHNVKVGQSEVKAGDYRASFEGNHLTLMNGKKVVAESDGRWEDRSEKSPYTEIVSNADGRVLELRFEGKLSVFVLAQ